MAKDNSQRILVGFKTQKDLQQARHNLDKKALSSASFSVVPPASGGESLEQATAS